MTEGHRPMSSVDAARKRVWDDVVTLADERRSVLAGADGSVDWIDFTADLDALIAAVRSEAPPQIEFPTYARWLGERRAENARLREALAKAIVDVHSAYCSRSFASCERCAYARDLLAVQPKGDA